MTKIQARLSTEQITSFRREGFLVLPGLFASTDLQVLADAFDRLVARASSLTTKKRCDRAFCDVSLTRMPATLRSINCDGTLRSWGPCVLSWATISCSL